MIKYLLFICLHLFSVQFLFAQSYKLKGRVVSGEDSIAIAGVHVIGEVTGNGTVTDKNGDFIIWTNKFPATVTFSHISYKTFKFTYNVFTEKELVVYLEKQINILSEISISANNVICLSPKESYYVSDYAFMKDTAVVAFGFKGKMKNRQSLIFYDETGNKIAEKSINNIRELYTDPDGNVYVQFQNTAFVLDKCDSMFCLTQQVENVNIDKARVHLAAVSENIAFWKEFYCNNQIVIYYLYDLIYRKSSEFLSYINDEAIERMSWGYFFDGNEFDRRFTEQIFFKPISIPLFLLHDTVFVFNFIDNQLEKYCDTLREPFDVIPIPFAKEKNCRQEIVFDKITGKFYAVFSQRGTYTIYSINTNNGQIVGKYDLKGYAFVEKIKVNNDKLYFLYKEFAGDEYKRLYTMQL